jgi:hypothetical protein
LASATRVRRPLRAQTSAMPEPIRPAPTTPTVLICISASRWIVRGAQVCQPPGRAPRARSL